MVSNEAMIRRAFDPVLDGSETLPGKGVFVSQRDDDRHSVACLTPRGPYDEGVIEVRGRSLELVPVDPGTYPDVGDEVLVFVEGTGGYYGTAVERRG